MGVLGRGSRLDPEEVTHAIGIVRGRTCTGTVQEPDVETAQAYFERKYREISLINDCLGRPLDLTKPQTVAAAIDQKFRVAAALRAERCLLGWNITETARPAIQYWRSGDYEFRYGYQRADLSVRGPPIYRATSLPAPVFEDATYCCSGMSAMAAVLSALSMVRGKVELRIPQDCYSETRELVERFGSIRVFVAENWRHLRPAHGIVRVVLIDSSIRSGFLPLPDTLAREADLLLFDTTCLWRSSARIRRVLAWALQSWLPLALVRSHAKLDSLGIEYGRLGSVVMAAPLDDVRSGRLRWVEKLGEQVRESVRLLGVAPILAHFPPFVGKEEFERCSIARTAAIIRNNRRITRRLASAFDNPRCITAYRHGLYFTLSPREDIHADDVKHLAADLCAELSRRELPVRHSGSFGFDFTSIDCFRDPLSGSNVIRVAASDIPVDLVDRIAADIARWWSLNGVSSKRSRAPAYRSSYASG